MDEKKIHFGSLFVGIGGLDLGLERVGMKCRWQVENDSFCNKVLERRWPDVRRYGDVKEIGPRRIEEECGRVQLIAGGFPCQDLSFAGRRRGIHAEKSGLWFEFERFIRELRPRIVLVENVSGLLSGGLEVVLGCLAAIGYDAEWDCVPAAVFGAPHLRHRVFIVAHPRGELRRGAGDREVSYVEGDGQRTGDCGQGRDGFYQSIEEKFVFGDDGSGFGGVWPVEPEPRLVRMADGVSEGLDKDKRRKLQIHQKREKRIVEDRVKSLGNAVVPQVAEWLGKRILRAVERGCI